MFFAPPKVKSLSKYAEFGTYLQHRDFLIMLGIAAFLHACIIGIYALVPHEEVVRIAVHPLNIRLGGGDTSSGVQMPTPASMPQPGAPVMREVTVGSPAASEHAQSTQNLLDKAFKANPSKPAVYDPHLKRVHPQQAAAAAPKPASAEGTLNTPKRYVREADQGATGSGQGHGKGAGGKGSGKSGEEIVERYEQAISYWISEHKTYPQSAKQQGIEGDAIVRIRIDRDGHILYNAIDRSSGNALIDAAVTAMVRASDPVPHVPEDYPEGTQLEFLIPVSFRLQ